MEIQTNTAVTKKEAEIYKKFKNLSVNETPKSQGDGAIRISPFDDYFIFTIYDDVDNESTPIDLSNVGTINLVFIGATDEIRIPNYTRVDNVDLSQGQVLFKIGKEDSKKILALDNKNFYVSTVMVDNNGESDESVLYTGTFLSYNEAAKKSLTDQLDELRLKYTKEIAKLQEEIESLNLTVSENEELIQEQQVTIDALRTSNENLTNEVALLSEKLGSTEAENVLLEAKLAQKNAEEAKKKALQNNAIKNAQKAKATKSKKKSFYKDASKQLRKNIPGVTPVSIRSEQNDIKFSRLEIEAREEADRNDRNN